MVTYELFGTRYVRSNGRNIGKKQRDLAFLIRNPEKLEVTSLNQINIEKLARNIANNYRFELKFRRGIKLKTIKKVRKFSEGDKYNPSEVYYDFPFSQEQLKEVKKGLVHILKDDNLNIII